LIFKNFGGVKSDMGKVSNKLRDQLSEFLVCEIGGKALDGITYTMLLKGNKRDMESYKRYAAIREELLNCGFSSDEMLRCFEVGNGYIFDMDLQTAKQITIELSKAVAKSNNNQTPVGDLIGNAPEQRRKRDMLGLGRYVKQSYDTGLREVSVALFNKNSTDRIMVTAVDKNGKKLAVSYKAYAIRHWDIEQVNSQILMPMGVKIDSIQLCEILPMKTGVSANLKLVPYNVNDRVRQY
jgi:hypothetical protein